MPTRKGTLGLICILGTLGGLGGSIQATPAPTGPVAILIDNLPGFDVASARFLATALRSEGLEVVPLTADAASASGTLSPDRFALYVVPNAKVYPASGRQALAAYLKAGGNLMALGGPAFAEPVWKHKGKWINESMIREDLASRKPEHIVFDFDRDTAPPPWPRSTNQADAPGGIEIVPGGPSATGKCLKAWSGDFSGWDTFGPDTIPGFFPEGHGLLCFWAKGDARTTQMVIELKETDHSRWMASVALTTEWTYYAMRPEDFAYWHDSATRDTRGGAGDGFHPERAMTMIIGMAVSHNPELQPGPHAFWIDDIGTTPDPFVDLETGGEIPLPIVESLSPRYKVYPLENIASVALAPGQAILPENLQLPTTVAGLAPHARPAGHGFQKECDWRWVSLAEAFDAQGVKRGDPMWMLIQHGGAMAGSIVAAAGIGDQTVLKDRAVASALAAMAKRTVQGLFLQEAGTRHFAYWPGEKVEIGATVLNYGKEPAHVRVRLTVSPASGGPAVFERQTDLTIAAGTAETLPFAWEDGGSEDEIYVVRTDLAVDGQRIDTITHEIGILSDRKPSPDEYVTVSGGDFFLKGEKWFPIGVNFWPVYVSGFEGIVYGAHWLRDGLYSPVEVERDLVRLEALGINMVSVQTGNMDQLRNFLDFLRRCGRHGIKVNAFLYHISPLQDGMSPLGFNEPAAAEFIGKGRLATNPHIMAYDTIWEPGNWMYDGAHRPSWDPDWEAWIVERYGSLDAAEADWAFAVPRMPAGSVTSPSDQQLARDGDWRVMVAAYRRFMDDFASRKWNDCRQSLQHLDPNHLISNRQGNTLPQDFTFTATAKHVDFMAPEGYAIPNSEDGYHAAGFITRYIKFTTRGKPIIWSEFGKSVWNMEKMAPMDHVIDGQAEYHSLFYRMALESGANGTAPWWWPGGYRVDERSDYGITHRDGTLRPSAEMIREFGPQFHSQTREPAGGTIELVVDRDAHPGGYCHLAFNAGRDAYAEARRQGKRLVVRSRATGSTSVDTPLVAVGNTPCNGGNPPKYLNAEFNWIEVRNTQGAWVRAVKGQAIHVAAGQPVVARLSVGNTQEAEWIPPSETNGEPGGVFLASAPDSRLDVRMPLPARTPYLADAAFDAVTLAENVTGRTRVTLQMLAEDRAWFGEKFTVVLKAE